MRRGISTRFAAAYCVLAKLIDALNALLEHVKKGIREANSDSDCFLSI